MNTQKMDGAQALVKTLADLGIEFAAPTIDVGKLRRWKTGVVEKLTGGLGQLSKQRKVKYVQGRATFLDSNRLKVERVKGGEEQLRFEHAILATGSRPATVPARSSAISTLVDSPSFTCTAEDVERAYLGE